VTPFEAALLGLVQGLTEFLPISSTAHLEHRKHKSGTLSITIPSGPGFLSDNKPYDNFLPTAGGVISPLLANVYLHVVLDEWFERDVLPRLQGRAQLIRYADDFVVVCEREDDARKVMEVLPKRFGRFGLTLHPDKTRLVRFVRPARPPGQKRHEDDPAPPQTFDFLGFTHRWGVSRKNRWFVERRTSKGRLTRALAAIRDWCRKQRHQPIRDQHLALVLKVRGHCGYYGIIGNARGIGCFHQNVLSAWRFWLDRRSQRARMTWAKFSRLMARYPLPCTMISPRNSRSFANP